MILRVNEVAETVYMVDIPEAPEEEEDRLYKELSCQLCLDDMADVESFLDEKGVRHKTSTERIDTRIKIRR